MTSSIIETKPIESEEIIPYEDTDDGQDHLTHIVNPPKNIHIWQLGMNAQDLVDIARATGQEIEALCGYRFIPQRNPDNYDVCDSCITIAHNLMSGAGE